jgi:UDP-N-acetylmuramoyl-tripeptide--D-alanyl-D-alanine ligase
LLKRIKSLDSIDLGFEKKKGYKGVKVFNDSYSANAHGFIAALDFLKKERARKKILITPGIIELGKDAEKIHRKIGKKAAKICKKIFVTKSDYIDEIKSGMGKKAAEEKVELIEDPFELFEKLAETINSQTAVLIEGRVNNFLVNKLLKND